jgi:hypothetical protein
VAAAQRLRAGGATELVEIVEPRRLNLARIVAGWIATPLTRRAPAMRTSAFARGLADRQRGLRRTPLRNPLNDVARVAASLKSLGFAVTAHENLKLGEMREADSQVPC